MIDQVIRQSFTGKAPIFSSYSDRAMLGRLLRTQLAKEVSRVVGADSMPVHDCVGQVLARYVAEPDLLKGVACLGLMHHYTRELLHDGSGYSILAIVWLPGQMSPVHCHRSWCALGVNSGELVETSFHAEASSVAGRAVLRESGSRQLGVGAISSSDEITGGYHRVANLGVAPATSIHVYGAAFDRLGLDLNQVWMG